MARLALPFLLVTGLTSTHPSYAQADINKMIQERMAARGAGGGAAGVQDDTDPFVPNTFTGSFTLETHHYVNGEERKDSPTHLHYWSTAEKTLVKMDLPDAKKGQDMRTLTDLKEKWTYMLVDDGKGGRTALKNRKQKFTMPEKGGVQGADVVVTEETKMIDGHLCTKVLAKSEEGLWTGWMAGDIPAAFQDMARNMRGGDTSFTNRMGKTTGMVLEFEWQDSNGRDKMHCFVRDLVVGKVDPAVFDLSGYTVTEIPAITH